MRRVCSKTVSQVKMWHRCGYPGTNSVSLPLVGNSSAQASMSLSIFCVDSEVFF